MLRKLRITLAALMLTGITLLFFGIGQDWWGWLAKLQFLPSFLKLTAGGVGLNLLLVLAILLFTFLFGRLYCSVICPLGIYQDLVLAIRRALHPLFHTQKVSAEAKKKAAEKGIKLKTVRKKLSLGYVAEKKRLRYIVFGLYVICLIAGMQVVIAILAPYSAYGRMVRTLASNFVTGAFGGPASPMTASLAIVAAVTFLAVTVLAALGGRTWCNAICPVGTFLSFFSRFAIFRPVIDENACSGCKTCEKRCRAKCIDIENKKIDYSRCVDCFDCIDACPNGSLTYSAKRSASAKAASDKAEAADNGRRAFLQGAVIAAGAAIGSEVATSAQNMKLDGGMADVLPKQNPQRAERLVPPGAQSVKNFYSHCTACQLCVAACPNAVLRPSTDLEHFMQPVMGYENGYCRPECNACSSICPAGAIQKVTPEEKTSIHIGRASVDYDLCIVNRDGVTCGNCSRHCPSGAIIMVRQEDGRQIPSVIEDKCIGCGACENLCPSRPISAITVNGHSRHLIS